MLDNVEAQLLSANLFKSGGSAARLEQLSASTSIVPIVPLLAAVHGLGTGSLALYDIFGFDLLHVCVLFLFWLSHVCMSALFCEILLPLVMSSQSAMAVSVSMSC